MRRAATILLGAAAVLYAATLAAGAAVQDAVIYRPSAAADAPARADVRVVELATADGETLKAWWRAPDDPGGVVFLYLGSNAERLGHAEGRLRRIAAHGDGALVIAYRGYSGSTGRPSEAGLYADARAGHDWLLDRGVAPDAIVIHGFSLGSGAATQLALERDARALILEAPFLSVDDMFVARAPGFPWRRVLRTHLRSRDKIARVGEPVLIVHGDADTVIPFTQGARLFALAQEPKRFVAMPGSDHATLTRDGVYPFIWAFLDEVAAPASE